MDRTHTQENEKDLQVQYEPRYSHNRESMTYVILRVCQDWGLGSVNADFGAQRVSEPVYAMKIRILYIESNYTRMNLGLQYCQSSSSEKIKTGSGFYSSSTNEITHTLQYTQQPINLS
jgi:hypothetical protein